MIRKFSEKNTKKFGTTDLSGKNVEYGVIEAADSISATFGRRKLDVS